MKNTEKQTVEKCIASGETMGYPFYQRDKARNDFRRVFSMEIAPFYDSQATVLFNKVCINPFRFDDWLHRRFGDYEERGLSMREFVIEKYGIKGVELLCKLI
jgi:hypothetical protein